MTLKQPINIGRPELTHKSQGVINQPNSWLPHCSFKREEKFVKVLHDEKCVKLLTSDIHTLGLISQTKG